MHKSSHNRPKDYVHHSIRDATLSGIVRSETPVPVSVCVLARIESNKSSTTTATPAGGHELSALFSVLSDLGCEPGMFRDRNVWQWNNDTFNAY